MSNLMVETWEDIAHAPLFQQYSARKWAQKIGSNKTHMLYYCTFCTKLPHIVYSLDVPNKD